MAASAGEPAPDRLAETVSRIRLPRVDTPPMSVSDSLPAEARRNPLFELLVKDESDVTGLLAYSLYKQNKRDWLIAFLATHGRDPDGHETAAFILAERLPRRIATYRRLAEDLLRRGDGQRPELPGGLPLAPANDTSHANSLISGGLQKPPVTLQQAVKSPMTWRTIAIMLVMLVAMAIVFRLVGAWLFGAPGR